jgi:hypothetical protein
LPGKRREYIPAGLTAASLDSRIPAGSASGVYTTSLKLGLASFGGPIAHLGYLVAQIGRFLGDWFTRKAMWASKNSITGYAATFKKFYGFLVKQGRLQVECFVKLTREIKDDIPQWLDNLRW